MVRSNNDGEATAPDILQNIYGTSQPFIMARCIAFSRLSVFSRHHPPFTSRVAQYRKTGFTAVNRLLRWRKIEGRGKLRWSEAVA